MSSRNEILKRVRAAQPTLIPMPADLTSTAAGDVHKFTEVLQGIGGRVVLMEPDEEVPQKLKELFPSANRVVSSIRSLEAFFLHDHAQLDHHSLEDVDIAVIEAQFGVAENGAVWVTEQDTIIRVLPFIAEHLVVLLDKASFVADMHQAYQRVAYDAYGFGVFIAGPSKTADIEQSLVLGAHGPKSMTILVRS
ncbi:lactate utilization protein [Terrimonas sp. NA20]|uniref:Lactate utilization protein n=1 Tax=Terrimonas ginsenosidimutans TaxID=2908004 RepID=A0ABS9KP24_9BACT|nr:LUD domain-containing protein [Terrimonas ginsenosidimutans]MCG2614051.1 lactate utilization protein [Terrimonas ginsenosidimutans]